MSARSVVASLSLAVVFVALHASGADAQQRRRAAGGESPPPAGPSRPRVPYAGAWQGTLTLHGSGTRTGTAEPMSMILEVADTATGAYTATLVAADGGRTSGLTVKVDGDRVLWQQKSATDVMLVYSAKLVAADSIAGTVARRDGASEVPAGTFALVRRRSPGRTGG